MKNGIPNEEHNHNVINIGEEDIKAQVDIKKIEEKIDFDKEFSQRIRSLQNAQLNQYSNIYFNKIKKNLTIYEQ